MYKTKDIKSLTILSGRKLVVVDDLLLVLLQQLVAMGLGKFLGSQGQRAH